MKEEINEAIEEIKKEITNTIDTLQERYVVKVKRMHERDQTARLKMNVTLLNDWANHLAKHVAKLEALEEIADK